MNLADLGANTIIILPLVVLTAWASVLLLVDLFIPRQRKGITAGLAALGLAVTMVLTALRGAQPAQAFGGMVMVDGFSTVLNILLLASGLAAIALDEHAQRHPPPRKHRCD
jgi:NADH-quinone oxidoreductase subunit N